MIRCVLLDLDGTIIDTNELIIESLQHVLSERLGMAVERERLIPYMGLPLADQFRELSGLEHVSELEAAYRAYNVQRHDSMVSLFPHVRRVVRTLHEHGVKLGVVTTKMRLSSERMLRKFELLPYMGAVVTIDDVSRAKPPPEPLQQALRLLGTSAAEAIMVGDSAADIVAGRSAGAFTAAVEWSLKGAQALKVYEPDFMLRDMRDLLPIVIAKRDVM